jgi:tRNA-Thr(GGU) m(6)t(6)A37 methyltransferase TsaA
METADGRGRFRLLRPLLFLSGLTALGLAGFGLWKLLTRFARLHKENAMLQIRLENEFRRKEELLRQREQQAKNKEDERAGRISAERRLRELLSAQRAEGPLSEGEFHFRPIGVLCSSFKERNGTPRQGGIAKSARSKLKLDRRVNPKDSLDGLDQFSHVWLVFVFHENTNSARDVLHPNASIKSKVRPPRLDGATVGLYATRTPHRPCPIGLSLARIVRIQDDTIFLAGADLIDGTPILDIKPYVSEYDSCPEARVPSWLAEKFPTLPVIDWSEASLADLQACVPVLALYSTAEEVRTVVNEILSCDMRRSKHRQRNYALYNFRHDNVRFFVQMTEAKTEVVSVRPEPGPPPSAGLQVPQVSPDADEAAAEEAQ